MPDIAKEYWKMDKVHVLHSLGPFCTMLTCISCGPLKLGDTLCWNAYTASASEALACCMMRNRAAQWPDTFPGPAAPSVCSCGRACILPLDKGAVDGQGLIVLFGCRMLA